MSSPNLDHQFSFVKKQLELDEAERQLNSMRSNSERNQIASRTLPGSSSSLPKSTSTTTTFKNLPSLPLPRPLPKNIPVPRGIGIDTSLYTQPLFSRPNNTPTTTTTTTTNTSRKNSDASAISGFSLSTFPPPPSSFEPTVSLAKDRSSSLDQYQRDVVVAEGGVEFEIFSPIQREGVEDGKVENLISRRGLNGSNINM